MVEAAIVFVVQLIYIGLLGAQSLNVNNYRYVGAFATSLMLGALGFHLTSVVAEHRGAVGSLVWFAYIMGGPCGIVLSMILHPRLVNLWKRKT